MQLTIIVITIMISLMGGALFLIYLWDQFLSPLDRFLGIIKRAVDDYLEIDKQGQQNQIDIDRGWLHLEMESRFLEAGIIRLHQEINQNGNGEKHEN